MAGAEGRREEMRAAGRQCEAGLGDCGHGLGDCRHGKASGFTPANVGTRVGLMHLLKVCCVCHVMNRL